MGLYKRILMEIIRRPFRALILVFMILTLSTLSMIGVFLQDIVKTAYEEYIKLDGFSIAIESNNQESIANDLIEKVLKLDHIIGFNNNSNMYDKFIPIDFINIPYTGSESIQRQEADTVILFANMDTSFYSTFRNGEMILMEGVYPVSNHKGVLIDEILAIKNGLHIGENIHLYSKVKEKEVTFEIIGVYRTVEPPTKEVSNDSGTYYAISTNSYLFCDFDSFFRISDRNPTTPSLIFYVDEYKNIDSTYKQIKELLPPEDFKVINCIESTLSYYGKVIVTLKNTTSNLLRFTYITSLFILFLMTVLWMRDHYYEAGIYIALGTEKIKIVLYFVLEILIISLSALFISLIVGRNIIYVYRHQLLRMALGFTNSKFLDKTMESKVLEQAFSFQSLLYASGNYLVIVVIATLLSSILIIQYKPRKLFDKQ